MGKVPANIDWTISASSLVDPAKSSLIQYELEVETASGGNSLVVGVPLQINTVTIADRRTSRVNGFEVERFSLILFDFDKASIDAGNKRIVDIIRSRTTERSQVEISAYTDRTGDAQYNKRLAERRAQAAKEALQIPGASARGVGEDILLYDNNLPEGRFYCRTVVIVVRTPL
jgi:outer membrane protein OmpA-like peptidoglycan-associated protein